MSDMTGIAAERIPFNSPVLCRGFRVTLAPPEIANGIAKPRPLYRGDQPLYEPGQHVRVNPIEGLGARSLQALADAPIMDASRIYLPAGKLTKAEADARDAVNWQRLA